MPSQLYKNSAIEFICARDFTYDGVDYKMGDDFDQDVGVGRLDMLIRTRRLFAVVNESSDKPRHWHHHVWIKSEIKKKLGLIKRDDVKVLGGSSGYNKPRQMGMTQPNADLESFSPWEETEDQGAALHAKANEAALTEQVLQQENEENEPPEDEQTEPQELLYEPKEEEEGPVVIDPEADADDVEEEEEEREVTEEDLYDPSEHNVPEVLEYLDSDITDEERDRVLAAEEAGKQRKGILE